MSVFNQVALEQYSMQNISLATEIGGCCEGLESLVATKRRIGMYEQSLNSLLVSILSMSLEVGASVTSESNGNISAFLKLVSNSFLQWRVPSTIASDRERCRAVISPGASVSAEEGEVSPLPESASLCAIASTSVSARSSATAIAIENAQQSAADESSHFLSPLTSAKRREALFSDNSPACDGSGDDQAAADVYDVVSCEDEQVTKRQRTDEVLVDLSTSNSSSSHETLLDSGGSANLVAEPVSAESSQEIDVSRARSQDVSAARVVSGSAELSRWSTM